jgi:hypothetical protein
MEEKSEFPLWWLDESKRNMEGLPDIVSHLQGRTSAMRQAPSGYRGKPNEMEAQLIETLTRLEGHVSILSDVVQASLQIVMEDHERQKSKFKRALVWIKATAHRVERAIAENPFYKAAAIASTVTFGVGLLWLLIKIFIEHRTAN